MNIVILHSNYNISVIMTIILLLRLTISSGVSSQGQTEFRCPLCKKKWPYDEVRKLAKLTLEEQLSFEEKLGTNTAKKIVDFRDVCTFLALIL